MELPNQDKIIELGEKETYKYFGILETYTIKQVDMKKKKKKRKNLSELEIYSKQNYQAENYQRNKYLGSTPR